MKIGDYLRTAGAAAIVALCLAVGACSERVNREDFATQLRGKTEPETLKFAGKPATVDDESADRHLWTYTDRTFDVNNQNKFDARTIVVFTRSAEGKLVVTEVKFE